MFMLGYVHRAVATQTKRTMSSEKETTETFAQACPVNPSCLGMCSWVGCPGNVDVAKKPHPEREHELSPLPTTSAVALARATSSAGAIDQPHPSSDRNVSGRFAFATDQELA